MLLHFGAVDYTSRVYVNGAPAAIHRGGKSPFSADITALLKDGKNSLCVYAEAATALQPRGKQSAKYFSHRCYYSRTTGIWQTVWLELVPQTCVAYAKYFPDISACELGVELNLSGAATLELTASYEGRTVGALSRECKGGWAYVTLPLSELHLWEPGRGRLYDLEIRYVEDKIKSYFGMRDVRIEGRRFLINGRPVFQRLVLDQGFSPDGIYTAPSDADLEKDILLSLSFGFNGARLHQEVFKPLPKAHRCAA